MNLQNRFWTIVPLLLLQLYCSAQAPAAQYPPYNVSVKKAKQIAEEVLKSSPVIDGHNDFYHSYYDCKTCSGKITDFRLEDSASGTTNIPLFRKGRVSGQLYNVYGKDRNSENLVRAFDLMHQMASKYPEDILIASGTADLQLAARQQKTALLPILEGAVLLHDSRELLRMYYKLGLRSVTLAYKTNNLADGSDDTPVHHGLSPLGIEMVEEMNKLGILIDMSHISAESMQAVLKITKAPVIFSHSNAFSLCRINRNVPDEILLELKKNKGIIMINFIPFMISQQHADWLVKAEQDWKQKLMELKDTAATDKYYNEIWMKQNPEPIVSVIDIANHFDYVKQLIGTDYIGIGSDLGDRYEFVTKDMSDSGCFPTLLIELARRGWTTSELKKIARENFLRVFRAVEQKSLEISKTAN